MTQVKFHDYDWIVINSSGGKDSQAMLDEVVRLADSQGYPRKRIHVVHANLGSMEWSGCEDLVKLQALHYHLEVTVVQRAEDLLTQVEKRGRWPSSDNRYCTSDHKRDQVSKFFTLMARQLSDLNRPARILSCMGMRAQESPARAKKLPFIVDARNTNGKRQVDIWLPIHHWTVEEVWARIKESKVPYHPAYDLGMPRLSCCFCIFAPESALLIAGKHNPALLEEYVRVERKIGHTFRHGFSIESIQRKLQAGEEPGKVADWKM